MRPMHTERRTLIAVAVSAWMHYWGRSTCFEDDTGT